MGEPLRQIKGIRKLADTINQLASVTVPELTTTDEMIRESHDGTEWFTLEGTDWWHAWTEITDIITTTLGSPQYPDNNIKPGTDPEDQYDKIQVKTKWTSLDVCVHANGTVDLLAEYDAGTDSWRVLHEGRINESPPDPIEIGRQVASAELSVLASETESCAAALDYWQTELVPDTLSQREWGSVRGVGRQTVNDRVREASTPMIREYGPNELYSAINTANPGDVLDFAHIEDALDNVTGGETYLISEIIEPFGDGDGEIRSELGPSKPTYTIRESSKRDGELVVIEEDGEELHTAAYVTVL